MTILLLDEGTQLLWGVSTRPGEESVQRQPLTGTSAVLGSPLYHTRPVALTFGSRRCAGLAKHVMQSGDVAIECVEQVTPTRS